MQFIQRWQSPLHLLYHLPLAVLSPAEYHAPPTTQQLEILEISLVVTMTERHCWHLMNGRQ